MPVQRPGPDSNTAIGDARSRGLNAWSRQAVNVSLADVIWEWVSDHLPTHVRKGGGKGGGRGGGGGGERARARERALIHTLPTPTSQSALEGCQGFDCGCCDGFHCNRCNSSRFARVGEAAPLCNTRLGTWAGAMLTEEEAKAIEEAGYGDEELRDAWAAGGGGVRGDAADNHPKYVS